MDRGRLNQQLIIAIFLIAAVLRFIRFPTAFYGTTTELFRDMNAVYDLLVRHQPVFLGPASSLGGLSFGPVYYYLIAPFIALFRLNPLGALFAARVVDIGFLVVLYFLLRLWFPRSKVAIIAILLAATSLYDIQNAYYISNPNPLPLFLLFILFCLTKILQGREAWYWAVGLGIAAGVATQLHATAFLLVPLLLVTALWRLPTKKFRLIFFTLLPVIATYLPYIIYETRHGWINFFRIAELGTNSYSLAIRPTSLLAIGDFFMSIFFFHNGYFYLFFKNPILFYCLAGLLLIFAVWAVVLIRRSADKLMNLEMDSVGKYLLGSWAIIGLAIFLFYTRGVAQFYFLALWPVPLILLAMVLARLHQQSRKWFVVMLCFYLVVQGAQFFYFYQMVGHPEYRHKNLLRIFTDIKRDAAGTSFNVINSTGNLNLVIYYLKLSGLEQDLSRVSAERIYFIRERGEPDFSLAMDSRYVFVRDFEYPGFVVTRYDLHLQSQDP